MKEIVMVEPFKKDRIVTQAEGDAARSGSWEGAD